MKNFRSASLRALAGLSLFLTSCQTPNLTPEEPREEREEASGIQGKYEEEIRAILKMARSGDWEGADIQSAGLYAIDPDEPRVKRLRNWVQAEVKRRSDRALEQELATISAQDSRFNPTVRSTFLENRKRGLPLPMDVRESLQEIDSTRLIPESYGQVIEQTGRLTGLEDARGRMADVLNQRITMQLDQVSLESIIFDLGQAQNINFIADRSIPAFNEKFSVNMEDVRVGEFLRYISRNFDVSFQIGDDLIWIVAGKDPANSLEETRFYRLRKGFVVPAEFGPSSRTRQVRTDNKVVTETITETVEQFVRDGAPSAPSLQQAIEKFFNGSDFMIDFERNLIVARGTHEELLLLERMIEEFDTEIQQVLIEARFITVTKAAFLQLGVNWETGRPAVGDRRSAVDFTGFGTNVGMGLEETFTNVFSRENLSATLTALEQSGESQTLSAPRITVINNRPATISDGKVQYYYEEYTVQQTILERRSESQLVPKGKPTKLTSGVSLDVLASIGGDGRSIMLALHPKVSQDVELVTFASITDRNDRGDVVSEFEIKLPESRDQELSTRVVIQSGQTVAMGGVVQRDQSTFTEAVPILSNIPIIGAAFRKRTEFDQPRYLLIFVTATLLSDTGEFIEYDAEADRNLLID